MQILGQLDAHEGIADKSRWSAQALVQGSRTDQLLKQVLTIDGAAYFFVQFADLTPPSSEFSAIWRQEAKSRCASVFVRELPSSRIHHLSSFISKRLLHLAGSSFPAKPARRCQRP